MKRRGYLKYAVGAIATVGLAFFIEEALKRHSQLSDQDPVWEALRRGREWLSKRQRSDGAITDDQVRIFSVWETVNATIALITSSPTPEYDKTVKGALDFLANAQRPDGALYHDISRRLEEKCLETSALYLYLLHLNGQDDERIRDFILGSQQPDGGFYIHSPVIPEELRTFPSVTGFALVGLSSGIEASDGRVQRAFEYLSQTQNEQGDWGASPFYYGTNYYPIWIISRAISLFGRTRSEAAQRVVNYIVGHQLSNGSFEDDSGGDATSEELRTILALHSLLLLHANITPEIMRGIEWLLEHQSPSGFWSGGTFSEIFRKEEDVYATSSALWMLSDCLRHSQL